MTESQLRALFTQIADGEPGPSRVDAQLAFRRGRARVRWRRACAAGAPVLAAATVAAVALAVTAAPAPPGPGPAAGAGPGGPRPVSPGDPHGAFGWLACREPLGQGGITPTQSYLDGGPGGAPDWGLGVYARGQCRLTGPAGGPQCPHQGLGGAAARFKFTARAPAVDGHRAFWAGTGLVWQYARGGWAVLGWPGPAPGVRTPRQGTIRRQREAMKIAGHVRYDVTTRLVFPAQFSGLPGQWRVHNISYYVPDGGLLRADEYMLTTGSSRFHPHVGDLGVWTDAAYVIVHP